MGVADDELDAPHAARHQRLQEPAPVCGVLAEHDVEPEHLAHAVGAHPVGHHHRHRDDVAVFAHVLVARVQPDVRVFGLQPPAAEGGHLLVQARAEPADLALADAGDPQRLHQRLHLPRAHPLHVGLSDHRHQGLLGPPSHLQEARVVAPRPQLRYEQLQRPHPRVPRPLAVAVATVLALFAPLVALRPAPLRHLGFHQLLHQPAHRLPQEVRVRFLRLAQQVQQCHLVLGHRVSPFQDLV